MIRTGRWGMVVVAWALAAVCVCRGAPPEQQFFRIASAEGGRITDFDANGYITWTTEQESGECIVETASSLLSPEGWRVYALIPFTTTVNRVRLLDPNPPDGMVFIPAGKNSGTNPLGVGLGETYSSYYPATYDLEVDAFYIGRYEVTNDEMVDVLQWAYDQGPSLVTVTASEVRNAQGDSQPLLHLGSNYCRITWDGSHFGMTAKGSGYPCVEVTWYGAVAYCNYRSLMEGLTPCYELGDWTRTESEEGYRLPTEDEWEYAARAGVSSKRFPWGGDTISHDLANYKSSSVYDVDYDLSDGAGYHPDYNEGDFPWTSPVGSFEAYGYGLGLYDMAGNLGEWCWDIWGPGSDRVLRGGWWMSSAGNCRVGYRDRAGPDYSMQPITGFRICRTANGDL